MAIKKKNVPIKYTDRDFNSIRQSLLDHAQRYYPKTFQDFNEAGFGSLMVDSVSYIGDILSFYLDYQANETFLDTSLEIENILKIGKQMGFKIPGASMSQGIASFFIEVPVTAVGQAPDSNYMPVLKKGKCICFRRRNSIYVK